MKSPEFCFFSIPNFKDYWSGERDKNLIQLYMLAEKRILRQKLVFSMNLCDTHTSIPMTVTVPVVTCYRKQCAVAPPCTRAESLK